MEGTYLWIFLGFFGFIHVIGNILLTRELFNHVPFIKERLPLLLILWFIPLIGAFYTFRKIGIDYYGPSVPGNTGVTADIMGIGEFFNPDAKTEQVIEEKLIPDSVDNNIDANALEMKNKNKQLH